MYATASANSDVVRNRSFASHSRSHSAEPLDVEGGRGAREKTQRNEFSAHPNGIHNRVQRAIQRDAKALTNAAIVAAVVCFLLAWRASWTAASVFVACAGSLAFAGHLARWTLAVDEGSEDMRAVSDAIRDGARGARRVRAKAHGEITRASRRGTGQGGGRGGDFGDARENRGDGGDELTRTSMCNKSS